MKVNLLDIAGFSNVLILLLHASLRRKKENYYGGWQIVDTFQFQNSQWISINVRFLIHVSNLNASLQIIFELYVICIDPSVTSKKCEALGTIAFIVHLPEDDERFCSTSLFKTIFSSLKCRFVINVVLKILKFIFVIDFFFFR